MKPVPHLPELALLVVQRIPVRIDVERGEDSDLALRPGMSVIPEVRVR